MTRAGSSDDRATLDGIRAHETTVHHWCRRLASAPVAPSLDHNDLHPWNIFIGESDLHAPTFYDWGDGVIAHPFVSMIVPLTFLRSRLKAVDDDPRILRVRDAYLEVFTDLAPHPDLVDTLELACRVGHIARALVWDRATRQLGNDADDRFAAQPLRNLGYLLDDSYLGAGSIWSGL